MTTEPTPASPAPQQPPKPVVAAAVAPKPAAKDMSRGDFLWLGWASLAAFVGASAAATARFMFPNVIYEPSQKFNAGSAKTFDVGVSTKWLNEQRVWIIRSEQGFYALWARCTHLGCTPNWLEAEQKFKCPCHGSGFYKDGINFEGPAPRPLERYAIRVADDGQLEVDKSKTFQEELGQWADPASFVTV